MPVSFLPCVVPFLFIAVPIAFLIRNKRNGAIAGLVSLFLATALFLVVYVPGWAVGLKASRGDAQAQFAYARWIENHAEQIGAWVLWPVEPDVLGGYAWLEKAAAQGHPEALFTLGVRLKYGEHVPKPQGWTGPGGNVFPQPQRGQQYIDKARNLGFSLPMGISEEQYYWRVYRTP